MPAKEHNNTLVMLYAAIGIFYSCGIIASPWIIETNFRRPDQIPAAIIVFGLVLLIAVLFLSSTICMHRRKPIGRTLHFLLGQSRSSRSGRWQSIPGGSCIL